MKELKLLLVLITVLTFTIKGQVRYDIPADLLLEANTAKGVSYLSQDEKDIILYMNVARLDGAWFITNIVEKNSDETQDDNKKYISSLISDLKKINGLPVLYPAKGLSNAARYHANDMGQTGLFKHRSSDGTDTFERIERFAKGDYMGENISAGISESTLIVLDLLIDSGIPSLGHRKNTLSSDFKYVGVAIEPHKEYGVNCVMDFSDLK